ncbi:MAG TPA: cyclic lactone autoinducer peptide [Clostridiaceae bacterium]|nr:cyclic lactone autoinducer peptide [Clostridiaceae bacterium]
MKNLCKAVSIVLGLLVSISVTPASAVWIIHHPKVPKKLIK